MRMVVHLSDLHFGRIDPALLGPLVDRVWMAKPDLVVISGDLTQRARTSQFEEAARFLARLPAPRIVVPGNHDVPLYDVFHRFVSPLKHYRRFISEDLEPFHADDEIAVAGINTARSLAFKRGRINEAQLERLRSRFQHVGEGVTRIVVTHHPFDLPPQLDERDIVGRSGLAMQVFADCGTDLLLSGHVHVGQSGSTARRYRIEGYSAVVTQAGTATSTRGRGQSNSFNVIEVGPGLITVRQLTWDAVRASFEEAQADRFRKSGEEWLPA